MKAYETFLKSKIVLSERAGFEVVDEDLHADNKPHQGDIVRWAAGLGRALIASSFGLGKTRVQCELARLIHARTGEPFLVISPLGVKHQFTEEDGPKLGMKWQYVRTDAEIEQAETPYLITNYERVRDGDIAHAVKNLAGVSLDEGSVLRSFGSKTTQTFKALLADVPYRFVATATPSPNEFKELIYYAEFLGVMDHGQALTRWFKRDSQKAGNLTLHPHHEKDFWMWVASWAMFLFKPSDLGYSDEGYELPELRVHWHRLDVDQTRAFAQTDNRGQRRMLLDAAGGVREAVAEKRATLTDRVAKMREIMAGAPAGEHWLLWHHMENERKAIEQAIPKAVTVYGSQELEERESRILGFVRGEIQILATKPEIAGSGCNFQRHCHRNIFLGIDYKFQDFIQAVHRTYRFQQGQPVEVHIIYAESEDRIAEELKRKWAQHEKLVAQMRDILQRFGLSHESLRKDLTRTMGVKRMETKGQLFTAVNNDCVKEAKRLPDNYAGLIHTSIPFGNHYEYTVSVEDFGHNPTDGDFWTQMDYLIPELLRVLKPGRLAAIHVKDRILYGHQTPSGFMEVAPFSDECVTAFRKHGFLFEGRRTIVTDVVRENASTYRLGWTEMSKDATKMGCGLPEYLLLFRKPPTDTVDQRADEPVTKDKADYSRARWQVDAHSFWRSNGNGPLMPVELYDYAAHVGRLEHLDKTGNLPSSFFYEPPASPNQWVWDDVVYMRTLNSQQAQKREQNHICPLPFDIVERTINLYSNKGEVVLDPFAGLFTVPMVAIKLGRIGHGIELNAAYFAAGVKYCEEAERKAQMPTLFDYLERVAEVMA